MPLLDRAKGIRGCVVFGIVRVMVRYKMVLFDGLVCNFSNPLESSIIVSCFCKHQVHFFEFCGECFHKVAGCEWNINTYKFRLMYFSVLSKRLLRLFTEL